VIKWVLTAAAQHDIRERGLPIKPVEYEIEKRAIQRTLANYFDQTLCESKASQIARVGTTDDGGKVLKMRWARPGQGKSGGFRLIVVAYCEASQVTLCRIFDRKQEPTDVDVVTASGLARRL
jgi:hypothetical protein